MFWDSLAQSQHSIPYVLDEKKMVVLGEMQPDFDSSFIC